MKNASAEIDAYIAQAAPFAQPILRKIRQLFHKACPDVTETMKWSFPHFEYKGVLASVAAFKHYVRFGFWKASLMSDPKGLLRRDGDTAMSGQKVTRVDELPDDKTMIEYIREAVRLNEQNVKPPKKPRARRDTSDLEVPDDLLAALKRNRRARQTFESFSYSHRKEYVEWINEAQQLATRQKRLATAMEWLCEGKSRHWKYRRK
jgi:uncharacterized protein YdeI (YjbR/CyaY-like superfamily)